MLFCNLLTPIGYMRFKMWGRGETKVICPLGKEKRALLLLICLTLLDSG